MNVSGSTDIEQLRQRAIELLARERRPMQTGAIAHELGVLTHQVLTALDQPNLRGLVWFAAAEGWSLPPKDTSRIADDRQQGLGT